MGDDSNKGNHATTLFMKFMKLLQLLGQIFFKIIRAGKSIFLFITAVLLPILFNKVVQPIYVKLRQNSSWIIWAIFLVITAFFLPILFNEAVQPIGSPRISTPSTEPLYIQSQFHEGEEGDLVVLYYQISEITYGVQPPMLSKNSLKCKFLMILSVGVIRCNDSLRIDLPKNGETFMPGSGYGDKTRYINVSEEEPPFNQMFIDSNDRYHIFVKVVPTATIVKTFPFKLYRREEISIPCSNPGDSRVYEWNKHGSSLDEVPRVDCSRRLLARGLAGTSPNKKIMYDFYELVLSNRGNLDIKGFMTTVPITHYTEVCEDNKNVNLIGYGDKRRHISIDLKSDETRRMIIMNQLPEEESKGKSGTAWLPKVFNFTLAGCNGDWNNQIS